MNEEDAAYIRRKYHTDWGGGWIRSPRHGLPMIKGTDFVPDSIVPFDKIGKMPDKRSCVVFNLADRRIDCFWNNPENYVERLKLYSCVAIPDFSLLLGMERQLISYNLLRAFKLARWMEDKGIAIMPAPMWAYPDSYIECFEALPENSIMLVSTIGCVRDAVSLNYHRMGLRELLSRKRPSGIVLYGPAPDYGFNVPVVRHFDRVSPVCLNGYQPELGFTTKGE